MKSAALKSEQIGGAWRDASEFKEHARAWADRIGVRPTRIQVQAMRRKWASCSPSGVLSFSRELLDEPRSFGEAVIVHELVHLKIRNHGPLFRSLLGSLLPGHETAIARSFAAESGRTVAATREDSGC